LIQWHLGADRLFGEILKAACYAEEVNHERMDL
jgi:hypothetical protein